VPSRSNKIASKSILCYLLIYFSKPIMMKGQVPSYNLNQSRVIIIELCRIINKTMSRIFADDCGLTFALNRAL